MKFKRFMSVGVFLLFLALDAPGPASAWASQAGMPSDYEIGSIIIDTKDHQLLFVRGNYDIVVYPIAVGRQGRKWTGTTEISRKVLHPAWAPPPIIRKDNPKLPALVKAGPTNPVGVAVLVLGDGTYGIHGTNRDETIGTDASYGCFRMHNADILALFKMVGIGTKVRVQK